GGDAACPSHLRREAAARGVEPERLIFAGKRPGPEHLARLKRADLFLDTFLYNAGATAAGTLQVGVPMLTKPGDTFLSRIGASLCAAAGLPELACASVADYEERAVHLATNPDRLGILRDRLRDAGRTAPLFDVPR